MVDPSMIGVVLLVQLPDKRRKIRVFKVSWQDDLGKFIRLGKISLMDVRGEKPHI